MKPNYYILVDKTPVPAKQEEAYRWMMEDDRRRVALAQIGDYSISTVFLVHDHNYFDDGPPLVFETMVFDKDNTDVWMERCSTWDEAEAQHQRAIYNVENGLINESS